MGYQARYFRSVRWWRLFVPLLAIPAVPQAALAIDRSVPHVRQALAFGERGSRGVVGVWESDSDDLFRFNLRNGIFNAHPAFRDAAGSGNFPEVRDFSEPGAPPTDKNGHGTAVAGVIAANERAYDPRGRRIGVAHDASFFGSLHDDVGTKIRQAILAGAASVAWETARPADVRQGLQSLDWLLTRLKDGRDVHAVNGSWGWRWSKLTVHQLQTAPQVDLANTSFLTQADLNASSPLSKRLDQVAFARELTVTVDGRDQRVRGNRLIIQAAGNNGQGNGLVNIPSDAYNILSIGALDNSVTVQNRHVHKVADYSSNKPLAAGRAGVHLVAPGTALTSANNEPIGEAQNFTAQLKPAVPGNPGPPITGTSFAAPHVTGAAAVLYGYSELNAKTANGDCFVPTPTPGLCDAGRVDHRVVKAALINSARKFDNWAPAAVSADGRSISHPLDYAKGSGELDAEEALLTFLESNQSNRKYGMWSDLPHVYRGWLEDDILIKSGTSLPFDLDEKLDRDLSDLIRPHRIAATLVWDRRVSDYQAAAPLLNDLDLYLEQLNPLTNIWETVVGSVSLVDNVEHFFNYNVRPDRDLRFRVNMFNALTDLGQNEHFALAWWLAPLAAPEPGSASLLMLGLFFLAHRWRARRVGLSRSASWGR